MAPVDFLREQWGNLASVLGLLVGLIGFSLTIWNVVKSKKAAQTAKEAVDEVRERIRAFNTVADLAQAVAILEEIKRLQRARQWRVVLDRYATLRKYIIQIGVQHPLLTPERRSVLTGTTRQLLEIEKGLEKDVDRDDCANTDAAKLNQVISRQVDQVFRVLTELQQEMGA
jgi:hypothetical protein